MARVLASIWLPVSRAAVLASIVRGPVSHALIWVLVRILMVIVPVLLVLVLGRIVTAQALVSIL